MKGGFPMKKLLCALTLLLAMTIACAALADGPTAASFDNVAYVNNPNPADRLNLRTKPSTSAVSLGKYYNGTSVTLLGDAGNGYWHVRIDPLEGYMDAAYLTRNIDDVTFAMPTLIVSDPGGAAVRSQPSQTAKVLYTCGYNSSVFNVLSVRADGWLHIAGPGEHGFIRADQLTPQLSYHQTPSGAPVANSAFVNNPDPTDRLHLRAEPRASAVSLGKYYNGVEVLVLGDTGNGYWHVRVNSLEGYMDAAYLSRQNVEYAQMPEVTVRNPGGTGANVRNAPSASAGYAYTASNGESLTVLGVRADGWLHVQYYGVIGFVRGELVTPEVTYEKR